MRDELTCSFCGKPESGALLVVPGPEVNIREECLDICQHIVQESRPAKGRKAAAKLAPLKVPP
ncbi:MAG: ClpX C4-type zinc finger protein, partial [Kiritimatiellae bacterium]|nr:ClpX C4-type zinc finger protein [Kiritimatiellia bacterium]